MSYQTFPAISMLLSLLKTSQSPWIYTFYQHRRVWNTLGLCFPQGLHQGIINLIAKDILRFCKYHGVLENLRKTKEMRHPG